MADTPLLVRFPILKRETTNITEWSIESSFMTPTDAFSFHMFDRDTKKLELQPVELFVNGAPQLIGRIDVTVRGDNGSEIECRGRDFMADLTECNIDPSVKIKKGMTLFDAITLCAGPVGIDTVFDDDQAMRNLRSARKVRVKNHKPRKRRSKKKLNDYKPNAGQGIFDFLNHIMAREGCTLQPGPNRNTLIIASPNYDQDPLYRISRSSNLIQGAHNNIISATATRDFSRFPTFAQLYGWSAQTGITAQKASKEIDLFAVTAGFRSELLRILENITVSGRWKTMATEVREGWLYRLLTHKDDDARTEEQIEFATKRVLAERLKDTLEYRVTLKGHVDPATGAVWTIDTLVEVDDDIADVHEPLWVAERNLRFSPVQGATTELVCWRPESFDLG